MADLTGLIIIILIFVLAFIISALPLYFAVKFLGGKTSILKTIIINLLTGLVIAVVHYFFKTFGDIIAFILVIWIYHEMFRLKWIKAILAWLLQFVFLFLLTLLFIFIGGLIGISVEQYLL